MVKTTRKYREMTYSELKQLRDLKWRYCLAWKRFNEAL